MKKLIFSIMMGCSLGMTAQSLPTDDYLYATQIGYDDYVKSYYVDICLQGEGIYTAFGIDLIFPAGMEVAVNTKGKPNIVMYDDLLTEDYSEIIYPYTEGRRGLDFTHEVSPNFPVPDDHSHARVAILSLENEYLTASSGTLFRVYVNKTCTSTQWPVGAIKLYDVELNKVGQPYNSPDQYNPVAMFEGTSTLPLTVSGTNHWSTCILPFATEIPEGVKAYTSSTSDEEKIFLTKSESIEAYTPYILYSENGFNGTVTGTVDASCPANGCITAGNLNGAIVPQTVKNGYILQNQSEGVKFYAIGTGDSFVIPAGKCWMNIADGSAKAFSFVVEDADGIDNVRTMSDNAEIYTLDGRKAGKLVPGSLYIKEGRKFINK